MGSRSLDPVSSPRGSTHTWVSPEGPFQTGVSVRTAARTRCETEHPQRGISIADLSAHPPPQLSGMVPGLRIPTSSTEDAQSDVRVAGTNRSGPMRVCILHPQQTARMKSRCADSYAGFADLARSQIRGMDCEIEVQQRPASPVAIIAPHGGRIERRTSEIARMIAGKQFSRSRIVAMSFCEPRSW